MAVKEGFANCRRSDTRSDSRYRFSKGRYEERDWFETIMRSDSRERPAKRRCEERDRFETGMRSDSRERLPKRRCEERDRFANCRRSDPRERLVKLRYEEKDGFETPTKGGMKRQLQTEREAATIELEKMENTAGIEINLDSFKELERLSGCSLISVVFLGGQGNPEVVSGVYRSSRGFWNPLEKLGLHVKDDCCDDDDDDDNDIMGERSDDNRTPSSVITESSSFCSRGEESGLETKDTERYVHDGAVFKKAESHTAEGYGESHDMIVREKCRSSRDHPMANLDEKALRIAMLKSKYSKLIAKAQQKTLFN